MPSFLRKQSLSLGLALWAALGPLAAAQEEVGGLQIEPTPFTAVVDFAALRHPAAAALPQKALPIWLESVQLEPTAPGIAEQPQTVIRIRLRPMEGLYERLFVRLIFDDRAEARPTITAWTETGELRYDSGVLGEGLELPASESVAIPVAGADYLEIRVPGDGGNLRQALLAALGTREVAAALDFTPAADVLDPFGNPISPVAPAEGTEAQDTYLFGRIRALLEPGPLPLDAPGEGELDTVHFVFELGAEPLLALITLELRNADPVAPPLAWINGEPVGAAAVQWPDLADPGYLGVARPREKMRFRHAGWLRGQVAIPGRLLRAGENRLSLRLPPGAGTVGVRNVELQLKHPWQKLEYTLIPQ